MARPPHPSGRCPKRTAYRGIWYFNQPSKDAYVYKYSGGFATYPQQHAPHRHILRQGQQDISSATAGPVSGKQELLHMVSYYDHATGLVPRPTILLNKHTEDAHDNPTISIDDDGYIWIFSSAHGTTRPSFIHRGTKPYSIDSFELIQTTNFSYTQPWYFPGQGFLFLHTRYRGDYRARYPERPGAVHHDQPGTAANGVNPRRPPSSISAAIRSVGRIRANSARPSMSIRHPSA